MRKIKSRIIIFVFCIITLVGIVFSSYAIEREEEILKRLNEDIDENLISTKYLVTDDTIQRVYPGTSINEIKDEWKEEEIKIYEDSSCQEEVKEGNIATGMALKVMGWKKTYNISVIGDLNKDGNSNQIELSKIIRNIKGIEDSQLDGIEKESGDITGDKNIDEKDIGALTNYIVFDKLDKNEIKEVKSPKVEVVEGIEEDGYYRNDVKIKITEENKENETEKTVYKIIGSKEVEVQKIENGGILTLSEDGIYKISAYTYGIDGNRSMANSLIVKIEKDVEKEYKVEHYKEKLDGSYELAETENFKGITRSKVIANAKEYIGFTEDKNNSQRIAEGIVARDGSLTLKLYYTRNEYTLTLNKDENIENVIGAGTYKYGATVSINATLKEEEGYKITWNKWVSEDQEIIADKEDQSATIEMPAKNVTLKATGTKVASQGEINYVTYDIDNVIDNTQNPTKYQIGIGVNIKPLTSKVQTTIKKENNYTYGEEYLFKGWYENENYEGEEVTRIDSTKTGNITLYAKWSKVVAMIVETGESYTTLEEAIKICEANGEKRTIRVLDDIQESGIIIDGQDITIDLNGKTISSDNQEATIINHGSLQIVDNSDSKTGKIINTKSIGIKNDGTLTLGENDQEVINMPIIEGETYGIDNSGTFYFYDGSVIGISPLKGEITETPENYSAVVNKEGDKQKATLGIMADAEARIGSYYYTQFEKALEDSKAGDTIVLLKNKNLSNKITISNQKDVVIDLNSYNIVTTYDGNAIENNGKLEIIDSSEERKGTISSINDNTILNNANASFKLSSGILSSTGGTYSNRYSAIYNLGNVEIAGGTVDKSSYYGYAIDNYGESLTISGGTVKSSSYAINNNSANQVTITGGTIKASNAINNNKEGSINILGTSNITGVVCNYNEGTIDLCGDDINVSYVQNKSSGIINQSAGTVERIEILSQNGSSNITGGLTKYISNAGTIKAINSTITSVSNSKDIDIIDSNISNVNNTGSMKITNCDVNTTNVAVTNLGSITIKNSNITTTGYGIDNKANGVINIDSVNITSSDSYGVNNSGTLVLGEKENTQSDEEIVITGKTYGVYNYNGNNVVFNYYRGVIKGKTAIYGYVDDVPANESILFNTEDNLEVARIGIQEENIVEIDGVGYTTLQLAIDICGEQQKTITVIKDINITAEQEIANIGNGKNIILDLNGHKVLSYKKGNNIGNNGTLTITDSNDAATGIIKNASIENYGIIEVENGDLYYDISSGVFIDNLDGSEFKLSGGIINIASSSTTGVYAENGSIVEISGGKISLNKGINLSTAIKGDVGSSIKVTGGTIESSCYFNYNDTIYSEGTIVIEGGTITSSQYADRNCIVISGVESKLEVHGGTIINNQISNYNGNIEMTGGVIEFNYSYHGNEPVIENRSSQEANIKVTGGTVKGKTTGGVIENSYNGRDAGSKINVEMTGGIIQNSNGYGIYNRRSTSYGITDGTTNVKITGGTVTGKTYGIYNEKGILTLGENDEIVSKEVPEVTGGTYGVNNGSTFNFYDGIIKGNTNAIYGTVESIADNREIAKTIQDSVEIATLEEIKPVAIVKDVEYVDLQEAINACEENGEIITILKDFDGMTSDESYIIDENKDIVIDLNGKNITYANEYMMKNSGKLEIKDSSEESNGQITGKISSFIDNLDGAEFKLSGGIINIASNSTTGIFAERGSTVEIAGGKLSLNDGINSSIAIKGAVGSSIKVTGGTIESSCYFNYNDTIYSEGTIVIEGGTITSSQYADRNCIVISGVESKLEVHGGTIINNQISNYNGNIEMTGGVIEFNYSYHGNEPVIENRSSQEANIKVTGGTVKGKTTGGVIENSYNGRDAGSKINVEMTGGIIQNSNGYGIYNRRSTSYGITDGTTNVKITGGTVTGKTYGIYNEKGILTLGENDEIVSKEVPEVTGGTYGVNNGSTFNFYDGIIKGNTNAIYGTVESIADNREIAKTIQDSVEIATLEEIKPVAIVKDVEYVDLQEAINACEENGEIITILKDFDGMTSDESYIIDENKDIVIDLNGKNITYANEYMMKNSGKLEIKDSSEESNGQITGKISSFIDNLDGAEFKLSGGIINIASNSTTGIFAERGSTVEIAGGKLSLNDGINSSIAIKGAVGSSIKVTGGTIESSCYFNYNDTIYSEGTIVIEGGTITSSQYADRNCIVISGVESKLEVHGGTIINNQISNYNGNIEMTGGVIEFNYSYHGNEPVIENRSSQEANIKVTGGTVKGKTTGGVIENSYNGRDAGSKINVEMTGGIIQNSNGYGIYNRRSTSYGITDGTTNVKITGGTVTGKTYGIYNEKGILTLGENDEIVSKEVPEVTGGTYGVNNGSTFNFYDGIIKGSTSSIAGVITEIPQGYKIDTTTSEGIQTAILNIIATDEAVVKVGSMYYMDLQTAINACVDGEKTTITLLKGIELESDITIPSKKSIKLDINGKKIDGKELYHIINNGTLSIIDSTGTDIGEVEKLIINNGNFSKDESTEESNVEENVKENVKELNTEESVEINTIENTNEEQKEEKNVTKDVEDNKEDSLESEKVDDKKETMEKEETND